MKGLLRSLITIGSKDSSKLFTLIVSTIISAVVCLCICFAICYDVVSNGYIKTNMEEVGIFILCVGGYLGGSSVSSIFSDKYGKKTKSLRYLREAQKRREAEDGILEDEEMYDDGIPSNEYKGN